MKEKIFHRAGKWIVRFAKSGDIEKDTQTLQTLKAITEYKDKLRREKKSRGHR